MQQAAAAALDAAAAAGCDLSASLGGHPPSAVAASLDAAAGGALAGALAGLPAPPAAGPLIPRLLKRPSGCRLRAGQTARLQQVRACSLRLRRASTTQGLGIVLWD